MYDTGDPALDQLARANPALEVNKRLEDSSNRVPTFWVKEKNSGHEVLMPRSTGYSAAWAGML